MFSNVDTNASGHIKTFDLIKLFVKEMYVEPYLSHERRCMH